MRRLIAAVLAVSVWFAVWGVVTPAIAVPGDLDPAFGIGGKVMTDITGFDEEGAAIAVQADGKIVVAGGAGNGGPNPMFVLVRYESDGTSDTTFGTGGEVTTDFTRYGDLGSALAIQTDGKIVAAGTSGLGGPNAKFALARYETDGTLDPTFGLDGKVTTDFTPDRDLGLGIAIQPDGKIIAAGTAGLGGPNPTFAIVRYGTDGTLDPTFGEGGKVTTDIAAAASDEGHAVALQSDGKIVMAGTSFTSNPTFALVRYEDDGTLDPTFGDNGKVTTDFTRKVDLAFAVAIQDDGKIVEAGGSGAGGPHPKFALARFETDGTLDTTFAGDGTVTTDFTRFFDIALAVVIQADGKVVVAGGSGFVFPVALHTKFALARYETDGTLDPTFGQDGRVTTDFTRYGDAVHGLAIQADGQIVAAGGIGGHGGRNPKIGLARYLAT